MTGKLDVREAAEKLPEEAEEPAESRPQYTLATASWGKMRDYEKQA